MRLTLSFVLILHLVQSITAAPPPSRDPCVAIGGQTWVSPAAVRACFRSFPLNETLKQNTIEVINKTLNFQTSINYQIQAPPPFSQDVHVDVVSELNRISRQQYSTEFDSHNDIYRTIKRLQDGHTVYVDLCYDSTYFNYLPFPVVAITENNQQQIRIAPEAFDVVSAAFPSIIGQWQSSSGLNFSKYSGATVLAINGRDPWMAVNDNAQLTGSFQGLSSRQNNYTIGTPFGYRMGDFAMQTLPMNDNVTLTVLPVGQRNPETINVPYMSQLNTAQGATPFTDGPSFRAGNCVPINGTNGSNLNANSNSTAPTSLSLAPNKSARFRPAPAPGSERRRRNMGIDESQVTDIALPPKLSPSNVISGSSGLLFFELDDGITGVLALGSFQIGAFDAMETSLLAGLQQLKNAGRTRLLIDLTNNGGGFVCISEWLHRIIIGPNPKSVPEAGLDTKARDPDIAQQIVQKIVQGGDPNHVLEYSGANWRSANGTNFTSHTNWLVPPVHAVINGRQDMFSQRLGQECQPFDMTPPDEPLFAPENVVILNNGLCGSSCALFTVVMSKHYNVTTVVAGGKIGTSQQYCGMVGGEDSNFASLDSEIKTTGLKNHPQAPPDFGFMGITWRLGFGINDPTQPEEWQDHSATINFPVTADMVNNPTVIWKAVVKRVFS
ncbi:hypothetical protein M422DRAFT_243123 [Sphaerobolus stellatus SS14]|nr:hypothetical protein M422DRAFT_243123 [Sphaerobolus stellatus SS14]